MEWIDGNIGSKLTMKYPAVYLRGRGARAEITSIVFAGAGQHQDAGAKVFHLAPLLRRPSWPSRLPKAAAGPPTAAG